MLGPILQFISNPQVIVSIWTGCWWGLGALLIWVLCLIPYKKGVLPGALTNTFFLACGVCLLLMIGGTDSGTKVMYLVENEPSGGYVINESVVIPEDWIYKHNYDIQSEYHPEDVYYMSDPELINRLKAGTGYQTDENVLKFYTGEVGYAMNIRDSGAYLCPSWIFNPQSLVGIPAVLSIPVFLFYGLLKSAVRGF